MRQRRGAREVEHKLSIFPAVAILGPRQVGNTTLVLAIASARESAYLDLVDPSHLRRLADPKTHFASH